MFLQSLTQVESHADGLIGRRFIGRDLDLHQNVTSNALYIFLLKPKNWYILATHFKACFLKITFSNFVHYLSDHIKILPMFLMSINQQKKSVTKISQTSSNYLHIRQIYQQFLLSINFVKMYLQKTLKIIIFWNFETS